ncbi:unnamed protein product [Protopolystoma xenopodis]|uniref:Kazal-like domain-containing protein n=1 Tax=Protopolystoma xenopodis TaxID=117903 RepID=A0A448WJ04_9PLAT|nr:unnamed protein product [Protopolystoma xenopodis]
MGIAKTQMCNRHAYVHVWVYLSFSIFEAVFLRAGLAKLMTMTTDLFAASRGLSRRVDWTVDSFWFDPSKLTLTTTRLPDSPGCAGKQCPPDNVCQMVAGTPTCRCPDACLPQDEASGPVCSREGRVYANRCLLTHKRCRALSTFPYDEVACPEAGAGSRSQASSAARWSTEPASPPLFVCSPANGHPTPATLPAASPSAANANGDGDGDVNGDDSLRFYTQSELAGAPAKRPRQRSSSLRLRSRRASGSRQTTSRPSTDAGLADSVVQFVRLSSTLDASPSEPRLLRFRRATHLHMRLHTPRPTDRRRLDVDADADGEGESDAVGLRGSRLRRDVAPASDGSVGTRRNDVQPVQVLCQPGFHCLIRQFNAMPACEPDYSEPSPGCAINYFPPEGVCGVDNLWYPTTCHLVKASQLRQMEILIAYVGKCQGNTLFPPPPCHQGHSLGGPCKS